VTGFSSEWWPESNRNGGRHQIGIPGRIASEFADENAKLKKLLAEAMLDASAMRELLSKKW